MPLDIIQTLKCLTSQRTVPLHHNLPPLSLLKCHTSLCKQLYIDCWGGREEYNLARASASYFSSPADDSFYCLTVRSTG